MFIVLFLLFSCGESDSKIESAGMETYIKSKILKDVEYVRWIEPINDYSVSAPEYNFNSVPFELMFDKNRPAIYPVNEFLGLLDFTDYDKDIFKTAESFNKSVLNGSIDYALVNGMYSDLFYRFDSERKTYRVRYRCSRFITEQSFSGGLGFQNSRR